MRPGPRPEGAWPLVGTAVSLRAPDWEAHVGVADVGERERARPHAQVVDEVVDAVVLRRLARPRVAADDRGAVDGDGQLPLQRLHFQLGQVLRLLVEVAEAGLVA